MTKRIETMSPGKAEFDWLYSIGSKQPKWFLGAIAGRANFGSWMAFLTQGLANGEFLTKFQSTTDVWERSKMVGSRISDIRKQFAKLSRAEKEELGRQAEAEFKAGVELLGRDKATMMQLIQITDPPAQA